MNWEAPLFILVAGAAFAYSAYRFYILFQLMRNHQGRVPPFRDFFHRFQETLLNVLGQKAVLRKRAAGLMHATIFWGFLIISLGTLEQFATTLHPSAHFEFIGPIPYQALVFLQDLFNLLVLLAVLYAAYRRFILKPPELGQSRDANWVLILTFSLMLSILLMNAFCILGSRPWFASAMPVASFVADFLFHPLFLLFSISPEESLILSRVFKWVHMLIVLGFSAYIPSSKHLHIVAAGPNTFLKHLPREKPMSPIRFEDESIQQYGAAKITDLSWKDTLDYYSCTECGRCQDVCPAHATGKPLSPKNLILNLKHNLYANKDAILNKKFDSVSSIIDEANTTDVLWACTSCRACEIACPVFIQHTDKIFDIRRSLVMMDSQFPSEVQTVFKNMETQATPWAFSKEDRAQWADGLSIKIASEEKSKIDLLLWVGCAGSYDERNKKVLKAFVSLLKKANVSFSILGKEEQCTGDPARRIGNEYLYQTLAKANVETLNKYQVKKIVTTCPHCFNTIKNEYKDFGGTYEVFHHSQFIAQLITEGKLKPSVQKESDAQSKKITFHDSCYLGRWNGIYSDPRAILQELPQTELVEMKQNKEQSLCCGAGGGRMWMEEKIGSRINVLRTEQAIETKADIVASSCPFCMTMMTDGVKSKEMQGQVKVMDIAELMDESIS